MEVTALPSTVRLSDPVLLMLGEGEQLHGAAAMLDASGKGALSRALAAARFSGAAREVCTVWAATADVCCVTVVGIGNRSECTDAHIEQLAGFAIAQCPPSDRIAFDPGFKSVAASACAVLGIALRSYRFDDLRTVSREPAGKRLGALVVLHEDPQALMTQWQRIAALEQGVRSAKDLVTEPPNRLTPAAFAERCLGLRSIGVEVEILDTPALRDAGCEAILGVAAGSANEPYAAILRWRGAGRENGRTAPIVLVGKGVTFDAGGLQLKAPASMLGMKTDMAGAAAVFGVLEALALQKTATEVVAILGLVENLPSGTAQRPGDVVRTCSGVTVEIVDTDAEGRLVLADLLYFAMKHFEPRALIDIATLTGGEATGLGASHAALFSNDDVLAAALVEAGSSVAEPLWRMPFHDIYEHALRSDIADMRNNGPRGGRAILAAQFLRRFVGDTRWAHIDIAGTAWAEEASNWQLRGATAFGVRLLHAFVTRFAGSDLR